MMWMDLKCQTLFFAKTPETRQHFVYFFVRAPGFIGLANEWQAFFGNFLRRTTDGSGEAAAKVAQTSECAVSRLSKAAWRTISPRPADSWVRAKVERSPRRLLSALSTERDCACGDWFWYRLEEKPIDLTFPGQALCGFHVGSRYQTLLSISARMSCRAKSRHL